MKAFYGTSVAENGTASGASTVGNTDCCLNADTKTNCPGAIYDNSST